MYPHIVFWKCGLVYGHGLMLPFVTCLLRLLVWVYSLFIGFADERSAWMGYKNDYYNYGYSNYPIFNAWWIEGSYMDRSYSRLHFDMWGTDLYAYLVVRYAGGSQTDV